MMKQILSAIALIVALSIISVGAAFAMDLDTAKSSGLIRENDRGLVEATLPNPSPDLKELIDATNAGRLEIYKKIAAERNIPLRDVQTLMAEKLKQEN